MLLPADPILLAPMLLSAPARWTDLPLSLLIGPRARQDCEQRRVHDTLSRKAKRGGMPSPRLVSRLVRLVATGRGATEAQADTVERRLTPRLGDDSAPIEAFLAAFDETDPAAARFAARMREIDEVSAGLRRRLAAGNREGFRRDMAGTPLAETRTARFVHDALAHEADIRLAAMPLMLLTILHALACLEDYRERIGAPLDLFALVPERDAKGRLSRPMRRWMNRAQAAMGLPTAEATAMDLLLPGREKSSEDAQAWDACWKEAKSYRSGTSKSAAIPTRPRLRHMVERASELHPQARPALQKLGRARWAICLFENMLRIGEDLSVRLPGFDPLLPFEDLPALRRLAGSA